MCATLEDQLDLWLIAGAERFRRDPEVSRALLSLAKHEDSRKCLVLLEAILETPGLAERLFEVLKPESAARPQEAGGMSWETFYLVCFLVGFFFSLLSFLAGFGLHLHLPEVCMCTPGAWRGQEARTRPSISERLRVSGVVRRHRLSADSLFERLGPAGAGYRRA